MSFTAFFDSPPHPTAVGSSVILSIMGLNHDRIALSVPSGKKGLCGIQALNGSAWDIFYLNWSTAILARTAVWTTFTAGYFLLWPLRCHTALSSRDWGQIPSSQNLYFKTENVFRGVFSCPLKNKQTTPSHNQQNSIILNCRLQQAPHLPSANLHLFSVGLSKVISHYPVPKQAWHTSHAFTCSWTDVSSQNSYEMLLLLCPAKFHALSLITCSGAAPRPWEAMPLHPMKNRVFRENQRFTLVSCHKFTANTS